MRLTFKKALSFLLALTMLLALASFACGAESGPPTPPDGFGTPPDGTPPAMPDGGNGPTPPEGEPPAMPGGNGAPPDGPMGGFGPGGSAPEHYDAVYSVTEDADFTRESLSSEKGDESVIHVSNGAAANVTGCTIHNSGDGSGGDNASFYGVGATLLVTDGILNVKDTILTSEAAGGTGIFAYGSGTAYVDGATISTTGTNSCGGLHVAGGGTLYAWNCDVTTTGGSSAAIRSDRGSGTMVIDGGTYVTENGTGAVYCTADITVHDATLTAKRSEGISIEGRNALRLFGCDLTCAMEPLAINDDQVWNNIIYQSMSGDSEIGTSSFSMVGGSMTLGNGPVLYTTNTACEIYLNGVDITYGDGTTSFLQCTGNTISRGWGRAGENGSDCRFTAEDQAMQGDVVYDTISGLDMYLMGTAVWSGRMVLDDSLNGGHSGSKTANVTIGPEAVWTVTGDSTITGDLYCEGTIENAQIVAANGTFGTGDYIITVQGDYHSFGDLSAALTAPDWADYAVEKI